MRMVYQGAALVVEDFPLIAADAEEMLNTLGYSDVVVVRSIRSALDQIARRQFAFALLSIVIDDGEIDPVAQALDRQNVPFMLVSDLPDGRDRPPGLRMMPFVTKPYAFAELAAAIARLEPYGDWSSPSDACWQTGGGLSDAYGSGRTCCSLAPLPPRADHWRDRLCRLATGGGFGSRRASCIGLDQKP